MNITTSVDSFDKLNCFQGVVDESTSVKRYISQTQSIWTCPKCVNIAFTCRHFGISRDTFYQWEWAYATRGEKGLTIANHAPRIPSYVLLLRLKKRFSTWVITIMFGK